MIFNLRFCLGLLFGLVQFQSSILQPDLLYFLFLQLITFHIVLNLRSKNDLGPVSNFQLSSIIKHEEYT
jgi:hypothetical protein